MSNSEISDSESGERIASDEDESADEITQEKVSDYEKARLKRIEENRIRMEALGLRKMASSLMESGRADKKRRNCGKGRLKRDEDEDEDYNPGQEDDEMMRSSGEEDGDDEEFALSKEKKKGKRNNSTHKKQGPVEKPVNGSGLAEDDDDLRQAIALSLQDSTGFLDVNSYPSQSSSPHLRDVATPKTLAASKTKSDKRKENLNSQDDSGKRKRKKPVTSRVQMSEDEVVIHFFQFDETGNGSFTVRDLRRLAMAHDFTWSEKEMVDMITYFDSDGDGKINMDDFHKIVSRCNMVKGSDDGKLALKN